MFVENINKSIKTNGDLNYKLKVSFEEAKKDETFKQLVDSINLNDDELMKYTSSLEDSSLEYKNCLSCKNLLSCKNNINGFCYRFLPERRSDIAWVLPPGFPAE